ncbi:MAG: aminotransferase class I/II-fold pyridoxal phosphate-dependent enzyme [Armatimonadetes bacterium]|nr:aminotransferase class I/II-fold pyridoxal phosphate-dependent enzyme [Armatimonadota bacterium]NIM23846.1 aminotransferase class I/II-fold pyridoxal phosphate-dependent enzyme [Armatimonadota bacterium]NIM67725.1 aminotransferase class I/II-fold pyridoxal phosphate-dependent enzyme [Armatimonadota bacterium]NIM76234.1 aminotransferase class I/II-fold pyridoxal phosphate-dependent enzyme [Armatimonadota bacterium]NIN05927.1 aminotransferase class I/II-fold pyridoxal phosphate-dependent enzym
MDKASVNTKTSQKNPVPFISLTADHAPLREEILAAIAKVLDSGYFILGENVRAFEEEFAHFCSSPHAVAVGSGTDALVLALEALGVGEGDEVIVPAWTFVATAAAVRHVGAKPVFVDCAPDSFLLDLNQVKERMGPNTRAIIPVHLYGEMADTEALMDIAASRGIWVIEDAAQSAGASLRGKKAGSMGNVGCFSFYPTKTLGACGEGGLVLTGDAEVAKRIRHLRNQADDTALGGKKYHHSAVGYNSRLQEIQAAILRIKLRHLEEWNLRRCAVAKAYHSLLADTPLTLPRLAADNSHVYSLFTIRTPNRQELSEWLKARGVGCDVYYPLPLHLQSAYRHLGYKQGDLPVAETYAKEVLSLPIFPALTEEQIERVAEAVKGFFRSAGIGAAASAG